MKVLQKRCHLNGHAIRKLELHTLKKVPCESTAEEVSFEWLHYRISSTDSKVENHLTRLNLSLALAVKGLIHLIFLKGVDCVVKFVS